ncbi:MAG: hypothetical protein A2Y17_08375 [Clostridiales bacterium GWF2_38_85]|nr:MAG: hypothetical protein A2Y17_08375 [Clostridiales bacterium GWF2_38_85]HBL83792.1 peptidase [Clostridiales bacterium]
MNFNDQENDFFTSPNIVDFIVEDNEYFDNYMKAHPEIVATHAYRGGYKVAYTDRKNLDEVIRDLGQSYISLSVVLGLLDQQALDASGITQVQQKNTLNLRGQGVLIGIVDTGIDYTNDVFRYADGSSKIVGIYDQTVIGNGPYELSIGTEYTREQINDALNSENPYSIVPEQDTVGHGTFLASLAAGNEVDDFIGAAPEAELIVVKLRKARPYYIEKYLIPPEQENVYESSTVIAGIEYILGKAQELNRPVAICLGLGTNLSSHNGFSIFEEYLSHISKFAGVCLCIAGGNESQAKHHFLGFIDKAEDNQKIEIQVGENSQDIYLSIWNNAPDRLSVAIMSPNGEFINRIPAKTNTIFTARLTDENCVVIVEYTFPTRGMGSQNTVVKIIEPTAGIWIVFVYGDIIIDGTVHAWLPLTGLGPPDVEFVSPNPNYTIVVPATAIGPICCGAYNTLNNSLYELSSWGPSRISIMLPDFVSPGVNVGGVFPDGYGKLNGTSVASAITTGAGALMLQWGIVKKNEIAISTFQIRAYLIRGCNRSPNTEYPNTQWGYGRMNLLQSFKMMQTNI